VPDFDVRFTAGAALTTWIDPETVDAPSRTNALDEYPHRYWQVPAGVTVVVEASIPGIPSPTDAQLGGRLMYPKWAEWPGAGVNPPPAVVLTPGFSAVMAFVPTTVGHYLFVVRRQSGGGIAMPFEVI